MSRGSWQHRFGWGTVTALDVIHWAQNAGCTLREFLIDRLDQERSSYPNAFVPKMDDDELQRMVNMIRREAAQQAPDNEGSVEELGQRVRQFVAELNQKAMSLGGSWQAFATVRYYYPLKTVCRTGRTLTYLEHPLLPGRTSVLMDTSDEKPGFYFLEECLDEE